jgi:hypothetical protein
MALKESCSGGKSCAEARSAGGEESRVGGWSEEDVGGEVGSKD